VTYLFYPGCSYASSAGYPESVAALNRALNIRMEELEDWNCCGATAAFSLDKGKALSLAGRVLALAEQQQANEIVTVCNACYTTLRQATEVLEKDQTALDLVNGRLAGEGLSLTKSVRVRHYLEVLVNDIPKEAWPSPVSGKIAGLPVAAYYGCQFSRPWGIAGGNPDHPQEPRLLDEFLRRLGLTPVEHSARTMCCGAAHAAPDPAACRVLVGRIVEGMRLAGAMAAAAICPMCQFNVDSLQSGPEGIPVLYFTQLAGLALGLPERELGLFKLLTPMPRV